MGESTSQAATAAITAECDADPASKGEDARANAGPRAHDIARQRELVENNEVKDAGANSILSVLPTPERLLPRREEQDSAVSYHTSRPKPLRRDDQESAESTPNSSTSRSRSDLVWFSVDLRESSRTHLPTPTRAHLHPPTRMLTSTLRLLASSHSLAHLSAIDLMLRTCLTACLKWVETGVVPHRLNVTVTVRLR